MSRRSIQIDSLGTFRGKAHNAKGTNDLRESHSQWSQLSPTQPNQRQEQVLRSSLFLKFRPSHVSKVRLSRYRFLVQAILTSIQGQMPALLSKTCPKPRLAYPKLRHIACAKFQLLYVPSTIYSDMGVFEAFKKKKRSIYNGAGTYLVCKKRRRLSNVSFLTFKYPQGRWHRRSSTMDSLQQWFKKKKVLRNYGFERKREGISLKTDEE